MVADSIADTFASNSIHWTVQLLSTPCTTRIYHHHAVGVGAVVINSKKSYSWCRKLPGGLVDSNETIADAVVRVERRDWNQCCHKERKSMDKGKKINSFYVRNPSRGSKTRDIYCVCLCSITGDEKDIQLVKQISEIVDLRWFDINEVFKMPLWKINTNGAGSSVDIHDGVCDGLIGFAHSLISFTPFAFNKGQASLYHCKL
eukprot:881660_1